MVLPWNEDAALMQSQKLEHSTPPDVEDWCCIDVDVRFRRKVVTSEALAAGHVMPLSVVCTAERECFSRVSQRVTVPDGFWQSVPGARS